MQSNVQQIHRQLYAFCPSYWYTHRTVRNPSTDRKAASETATAKPDGTRQTFADRQWQDPSYYPEPEQIYVEMDDEYI